MLKFLRKFKLGLKLSALGTAVFAIAFALFLTFNSPQADAITGGDQSLSVTRGGTGLNYIPDGYGLFGDEISKIKATSTMSMASSGVVTFSKGINVGDLTISAVTEGDLYISSKLGVGTTTPANVITATDTASSTIYMEATNGTSGSRLILTDSDGAGCSEIYILDGTIASATIACPY